MNQIRKLYCQRAEMLTYKQTRRNCRTDGWGLDNAFRVNDLCQSNTAAWAKEVGVHSIFKGRSIHCCSTGIGAGRPNFCGQCVSFVTTACPTIPVGTHAWKQGDLAKGSKAIVAGTAIATFDSNRNFRGHCAIYESQDDKGLNVVDQWVEGIESDPHSSQEARFGAAADQNNGDKFYVIELKSK